MPHRRPKPSIVLGAVAALAVATPFAVSGLTTDPSEIRTTSDSVESVSPNIAEIVLASVPDLIIPLEELTGLNLPDVGLAEIIDGLPQLTTAPDPTGAYQRRPPPSPPRPPPLRRPHRPGRRDGQGTHS